MTSNRLRRYASRIKTHAASCASRFARDSRGNATMLVAFAMPMIIGGGGMAIDFGQFYLWKRELQYANDQAAIAAAWEMIESGSQSKMSERALYAFRTNEQVTNSFNQEPTVELAFWSGGDEDGNENSVIVTSSATKRLPFTSFFTKDATTVAVKSQATFAGTKTFTSCLKAIEEDVAEGTTITIGGNAIFTAKCGIMALSASSRYCVEYDSDNVCTKWEGEDAISNNGTSYELEAGTIVTAGTVSDDIKASAEETGDEIFEKQPGLTDEFADLDPPEPDSNTPTGVYTCSKTNKKKLNEGLNPGDDGYVWMGVANPGLYEGGITVSCDTTFKRGVYYLSGGSLTINGNYAVSSEKGVMFVLYDGADFKINGGADINLNGMENDQLLALGYTEEEANTLDRMLVWESRDNDENNGNILNGSSNTYLNGAFYTPVNTLNLQGTADVANACLLIVANKINLTGTLNMRDFCENDPDLVSTTVIFGTVKLVG
ncbi:TadE/TadG family type IV pilus assembly protein [Croceicoccus mobilis]|uniref:Putative Flp pilus-assembly TadG-like N-terminal domain-containing protein n=1 Tax=Croceicoccus mobilis TaxID=1703339 RepID=A0A916YWV7_9SPHN|nr:TadE/TadG family type IV pilus assembly protein [Croceicoccus mobilis]GGD63629.1 hypothetical protein GCM10010990_11400 [Croceicoccus mobilis]